ncbi:MAG TPA: YraN family protein [Verrucomicrobiales bacterium]|nr:YraN family protein [Verrucomicrobiales bacterium]
MEIEGRALTPKELGAFGERLAARYLSRGGFRILYRNFRPNRRSEIDLVCREGESLVFVEVKTRRPGRPGRPADAVDWAKRKRILRGVREWLRLLEFPGIPVRCDIVEVELETGRRPRICRVENAIPLSASWRFGGRGRVRRD